MAEVRDKARADALTIGRFEPDLLENADETGPWINYRSGVYELLVWGDWDGASVTLQQSPDDGVTVFDIADTTVTTSSRIVPIYIGHPKVRMFVTSAGSGTLLNASMIDMQH